MARPSGTLSLDTGDTVGNNVTHCYLVTADATVTDMKGTGPNLTRTSSPTYQSDTDLGESFTGTGAGYLSSAGSGIPSPLQTGPFTIGTLIKWIGSAPSGGDQDEIAFCVGDTNVNSGGRFMYINVGDGVYATAGKLSGSWRGAETGQVGRYEGPTVSDGSVYAVAFRFGGTDGTRLFVNGTGYAVTTNGDSFDNTISRVALLELHRATGHLWPASAGMRVAFGWISSYDFTNTHLTDWTNDPWAMFSSPAAGGVSKTTLQTLLGVG